jgi:hypothetical protein
MRVSETNSAKRWRNANHPGVGAEPGSTCSEALRSPANAAPEDNQDDNQSH